MATKVKKPKTKVTRLPPGMLKGLTDAIDREVKSGTEKLAQDMAYSVLKEPYSDDAEPTEETVRRLHNRIREKDAVISELRAVIVDLARVLKERF